MEKIILSKLMTVKELRSIPIIDQIKYYEVKIEDEEQEGIVYLNIAEREGFACNTPQCPCGADYGTIHRTDVRCRDCALEMGWIKEVKS